MKALTIRAKITLWYTGILLFLLGIFSIFIYLMTRRVMYQSSKDLIKAHAEQVASSIEVENGHVSTVELHDLSISGTYIAVYDKDGKLIAGTEVHPKIAKLPRKMGYVRRIELNENPWLIYDLEVKNDDRVIAWIRANRSLSSVNETLDKLKVMILIGIPLSLLIAAFGGIFLAKRALLPIDQITRTAREIGQGDLTKRLHLPRIKDEVGRLVMVFDEMLDRLEASFKRERQFTSDASHELRTPITVISAQAEEALAKKRNEEEYREALQVILIESKKMGQIITQLLTLTRGDLNRYKAEMENIDLGIICEEVVGEMKDIAQKVRVKLMYEGVERLIIKADQALITRLLINLIENAIKYNHEEGWVKVILSSRENYAEIKVVDNGVGISKEHIPHIFDRFYRVNEARSRDGTGLGLSIVKWIVDLHKGEIKVNSELNKGTTFTVILPKKD